MFSGITHWLFQYKFYTLVYFIYVYSGIIKVVVFPVVRKIFKQICEETEITLKIWKHLVAIFLTSVIFLWKKNNVA
jgi:hypothetical protein